MDKFSREPGLVLIYGLIFAAAAGYFGYTVRDIQATTSAQVSEMKAAADSAKAEAEKTAQALDSMSKALGSWSKSVEERLAKAGQPYQAPTAPTK